LRVLFFFVFGRARLILLNEDAEDVDTGPNLRASMCRGGGGMMAVDVLLGEGIHDEMDDRDACWEWIPPVLLLVEGADVPIRALLRGPDAERGIRDDA
jgi:hypothetical protein